MATDGGSFAGVLPKNFHDPRIAIEGDRLKLGLRYGKGFWSTIVSVELRIWLVADEVNLMGMEVCGLHAGRLGISAQSILDAIEELAREAKIDVTWYRHGRNPVGLFKFFPDQPRPVSQVLTLEVRDDGQGFDPTSVRRGHGLDNLSQWAAETESRAALESAPGAGTRVCLQVPYAARAAESSGV